MQPRSEPAPPAGVVDLWLRPTKHRFQPAPAGEQSLTPDEYERASRFVSNEARTAFVVGRSLLRTTLAGYLGCAPEALVLDERCTRCGAQHGKPRLIEPASDLTFNLSHARGLVALAVCRGHEVGIDVEWQGRASAMPELVPWLLSPLELEALEAIPEEARPRVLLDCWVRKEALLKATGEGLTTDLRELALPLGPDGPPVFQRDGDGTWWGVCRLDPGRRHVGAVAVQECVPLLRPRTHLRVT